MFVLLSKKIKKECVRWYYVFLVLASDSSLNKLKGFRLKSSVRHLPWGCSNFWSGDLTEFSKLYSLVAIAILYNMVWWIILDLMYNTWLTIDLSLYISLSSNTSFSAFPYSLHIYYQFFGVIGYLLHFLPSSFC